MNKEIQDNIMSISEVIEDIKKRLGSTDERKQTSITNYLNIVELRLFGLVNKATNLAVSYEDHITEYEKKIYSIDECKNIASSRILKRLKEKNGYTLAA